MEANSKEWILFRRGKFSGSEIYKLMGEKGGITTATAKTYILEKVTESLLDPEYIQPEMDTMATRWGKDLEGDASDYFSLAFNYVGMVEKPDPQCPEWAKDDVCGSVDGVVYPKDGKPFGIEIKCPFNSTNHTEYCLMETESDLKSIKKEYYWQILHYMLIYEFDYYEFVSYDPRFTGAMRMFVLPVHRKNVEADIQRLKENILLAITEKHKLIEKLSKNA